MLIQVKRGAPEPNDLGPMQADIVQRNAGPVPRYTSYPTAPNFTSAVGAHDYADWLRKMPADARLSLYIHIPFCNELCWYCACNTRGTRSYAPVSRYVVSLLAELERVADRLDDRGQVTHIHWGGGSPDILEPADVSRIAMALSRHFRLRDRIDHAVEIDPRILTHEKLEAFRHAGVNRVSIGVQDFDPAVQTAINRVQSFEATRAAVEQFRAAGVSSINIDLVYGLPGQTLASLARTLDAVIALMPDRLAAFGYAHVPAKARQQRLIDASRLPGPAERIAQFALIAERMHAAGYRQIGIDHFARPADPLARGPVRRNFQGYTTDDSDAIIGLGASAIGKLPAGYVQNATAVADYARAIADGELATVRGIRLTPDDRLRAHVIERLMCDFAFSRSDLEQRFGALARPVIRQAEALLENDTDGFVERTSDGFRCTGTGRMFVRTLCTRFDAYWGKGSATHALAV